MPTGVDSTGWTGDVGIWLKPLAAGLPAGTPGWFTTREGGTSQPPWAGLNLALHVGDEASRALANRDLLARHLGTTWVNFPQQVHGAGVLVVDEARAGRRRITRGGAPGVDALVTARPGIPIGVLVADCMPVLLSDPIAGVVAAAHVGRRGLASGVLQSTLEAMAAAGAAPARVEAVIGPSICGRCYEVPAEMRDEVDAVVPGAACETAAGTPGLDLVAGALRLLRAAGVSARAAAICTAEDPRFFSYRRDGVTGRFAGVVMLSGDDD
jgi:YfiH family protein